MSDRPDTTDGDVADPADPAGPAASTHADPAGQPRWGIPDAVLAFAAGLVLSNLLASIAYALVGGSLDALPVQLPGLVGLWLGLIGVPVLISRMKGTGSLAADFGLRIEPRRDVPIGIAAGLLSQYVLVPLVFLVFRIVFDGIDGDQQARDLAGDPDDPAFYVRAVAFVVGAPLAEELFFRGVLQRALTRRLGAVVGIVLGSVIFGVNHFQRLDGPDLLALLTALTAFGVVLAVLVHRTGRLGPALVAHATFNAATMVALALT